MSIVADQVRRIDAEIDRILLHPLVAPDAGLAAEEHGTTDVVAAAAFSSPRVNELLRIVRTLSTTSASEPLLPAWRIRDLLHQSGLVAAADEGGALEAKSHYESEIEWLLIGKATTQAYGLILNTLLDEITPLSNDIWYWDDVLGSYTNSSIYAIQTSPLRWWSWTKDIYHESRQRIHHLGELPAQALDSGRIRTGLSQRWRQFYSIVRESITDRSIADMQRRILSPVALCRSQARQKQARLKKLREMTASGLGVLIDEGLSFGVDDEAKGEVSESAHEWKGVVERSVALMDMVLKDVTSLDAGISEFEDKVFAGVEEDPELSIHVEDTSGVNKPAILARRLLTLLRTGIPEHIAATDRIVNENGRPSRLVRYWLPAGILVLSSSTILRILVNRRDDIIDWITNFGATVRDFWFNWVVDPIRKVIGTIRHDENSEIAIMSRDSLKADRESLERMVVDFAVDKPSIALGESSATEAHLAEIRAKVKEGDVTPVLRAYERDLRKPFMGAVKGDLVRSLLIQVQKTKVDLEVAISGIDSLLKSQELVFGFVGLTPGVLVSWALLRYLQGALGGRKGMRRGQRAGRSVRVLRNIDRIFSEALATQNNNLLPYKDHGLLVAEVHVLRQLVHGLMPGEIEKEFLEDLDDLANVKGIQQQVRALERIRWAYAKWLR
ncbi:ATP synthase regulation protein NCA2 [Pleurostoma richardsiae]|uniref:ATP synthase regulation protein NCA2 n=1 Tax=Pleurostoma richardsiae TaxID=41990 RepID=A0AA38R9F7_9PEZI|nr:ATP synthase regulation protein NCA2 [Pleurostoma richardsiae]